MRLLAGGVWLFVAFAGALLAQQDQRPPPQSQPTFRTAIDIARVTVRVLDDKRQPVRGLTEKDFTILVDGKPRPILAFAPEDADGPISPSAPWMRDVAPDVASNDLMNPRLVVIILDDAMAFDVQIVESSKQIARAAIDELGPNDLASIVFSRDNRAPQDFTTDRAKLLAAVDRMTIGFHPSDSELWKLAKLMSRRTLQTAITSLRTTLDRRSMLMHVSIGLPCSPSPCPLVKAAAGKPTLMGELEHELADAQRVSDVVGESHLAGVPVYGISPLGLVPPQPGYAYPISSQAVHGLNGMNTWLRDVSEASGGRAIINTNAPARDVPRVFAENSLHYVIGYDAGRPLADGRYSRVQVRVNRRGLTVEPGGDQMVFSPKAPTGTAPTATTRALGGLVPRADEPLRVVLAAFADPAAESSGPVTATLAVAIGVDAVGDSGSAADEITVEWRVFDGEGRAQLHAGSEAFRVPPSSRGRDRGFDFLTTLPLAPGRYNVRVSAHSRTRDRSGSIHTDIAIPDYARAGLSISDVVMTAPLARTATPASAVRGLLPVLPTTARAFAKTDRVAALLRIYWGTASRAGAVTMTTTITDTDNREVLRRSAALAAPDGQAGVLRSAEFRVDVPVADLTVGDYLLAIRARPATGAELVRHVRFTVRDSMTAESRRE